MSNCRYHIHVICADNDQLLVLDSLSIFFQSRAFLTHDVSSKLPKASLYGRQCIDSCDYALMIIGDSYGTVQKTGVSQMHLSYLNAKAKLKPLLIFIKNHHQDANISRQLQEFIKSVTRQDNELYYYDTENDIEQLLVQAYYNVVSNHKVSGGWVRASEEMIKFSQQTVAERFADLLATNKANNQDSNADDELIADKVSRPIVLMEAFNVKYSAQAYEGGNLTDVSRTMLLTWREILVVLMNIPSPFSSYGLQNAINRLIASKAERDIKKDMPNVHAVSRCQIFQDDLNNLQRQLVAASWIQLTTYGTRVSQELWKLTAYAKNLLSNEDI
ncbi:DUF4062 domain-containing protein [Psychrobacter sp. CCUG 69069]|uniref:DUF4062 domain-containing protein n=1 Tax=Psychrobacter namhaensis TaxID=292734 RepID=A0ABW8LBC5_9GAMM|nr:DUF4062 domain-containing protein [Psychrobacter sp. CCUG 69069]MCD1279483.1 DUF4062 domain-containing protein [Psychrobacter sp. CCUG 69069]